LTLDGVTASTGATCHADSVRLSPVLRAMAVPPVVGMGAVRLSLERMTTEAEIDEVLHRLDALPDDRDERSAAIARPRTAPDEERRPLAG
jgi:cysteine sulfinate desulfinase/cysteine desulfurase-like protein